VKNPFDDDIGDKVSIVDWLDILDPNHMMAFKILTTTGKWPDGFIPWDEVEFPHLWLTLIHAKMAEAWVNRLVRG